MSGKKLQGQTAIITGASRGIGAATARRLAAAGANVALLARDEEAVADIADSIEQSGGQALGMGADVSDPETLEPFFEATLERFRRVDILVNNAGVVWPLEEVVEADIDEWAYNIHVNLVGAFTMARTVLPLMLDQEYGCIVNISSGAAGHPIIGASAYCAAKAGLDMFTQTLALELQGTAVRANIFYPGMTDTDMQADIRSVDTDESKLDFSYWHSTFEEGRLWSVDAVADCLLWIAGPWGRSHSGVTFNIDDPVWFAQVQKDLSR